MTDIDPLQRIADTLQQIYDGKPSTFTETSLIREKQHFRMTNPIVSVIAIITGFNMVVLLLAESSNAQNILYASCAGYLSSLILLLVSLLAVNVAFDYDFVKPFGENESNCSMTFKTVAIASSSLLAVLTHYSGLMCALLSTICLIVGLGFTI